MVKADSGTPENNKNEDKKEDKKEDAKEDMKEDMKEIGSRGSKEFVDLKNES